MASFVQLHFLTSYPASLLNRDDVGYAKRIPFGGASRTRISSQCLKRHWRTHEGPHSLRELDAPESVRSRLTFDRYIRQPLEERGFDASTAREVTRELMALVLGSSEKAKKKADTESPGSARLETGQLTILGRAEIDFLLEEAAAVCKACGGGTTKAGKLLSDRFRGEAGRNLQSLRCAAGLDGALFGRMVTSDILARGDAAVHVAHAFTVHAEATESDYFSAVDDLLRSEEEETLGSAHIGTSELTTGLFYGYVAIDVPHLVSNLEGSDPDAWEEADRSLAGEVVDRLVHIIATVSPGAKLGSTAPHSYASLVLGEWSDSQPRTLANAFLKPVASHPDLLGDSYRALATHVEDLDRIYGDPPARVMAALGPVEHLKSLADGRIASLGEVAAWAAARVRGTRA